MPAGQASAQEKLKIGTEGAYPPFNYAQADGTLGGFDIDLGKALCEEMKVECEFIVQDFDGSIPALQAGKFDAIINITITPERAEKVDFTHKYYQTPPAIAAPKDSTLAGTTPNDLKGKTLGVQSGTIHQNFAEQKYSASEIKAYPTGDDARTDMANGRLDAMMDGTILLTEWLKTRCRAPAARCSACSPPTRRSTAPASASRCQRARPWHRSSTRRSMRCAPTENTRKSTTSILRSTSTAADTAQLV